MAKYWELETATGIYFWGGIFSNWYIDSKHVLELPIAKGEPNGRFNCVEQYMMVKKARQFGDMITEVKILLESDPRKQKALGREVKPFVEDVWSNAARDAVYPAVYTKFATNKFLSDLLLSTDNKVIVEASPYDKIWGIGIGTDEGVNLDDVSTWQGKNWLGQLTMCARNDLRNGTDSSFTPRQWSDDPTKF